jgi:alpha-beta hydrolase superfamily lysophospholipase
MRLPARPPELCTWTLSDGYALRGRYWPAPGARRAVLYLHGIQSHGGWFEWSASLLASAGTAVLLPDRRGSGLNQRERGDVPHRRRWLADLDELAVALCDATGVERIDLVGVSWGGKLAAAWALARPQRVDRLLLIAPGLFPAVDIGLLNRVRIAVALSIHPRLRLPIPLDDPALFTDNPEGRTFIAQDPLKLTHATARFFFQSARLDRDLLHAPARALTAPVTLLLAGRERIVLNSPTRAWLARISSQPPEIREFASAAHTLEFDQEADEFRGCLFRWASE